MNERRHNWKENLGQAARERDRKKLELLTKLDQTREQIHGAGLDFDRLDALRYEQRQIAAKLAAL